MFKAVHTCLSASRSAPRRSSTFTTSLWPIWAAIHRGAVPSWRRHAMRRVERRDEAHKMEEVKREKGCELKREKLCDSLSFKSLIMLTRWRHYLPRLVDFGTGGQQLTNHSHMTLLGCKEQSGGTVLKRKLIISAALGLLETKAEKPPTKH